MAHILMLTRALTPSSGVLPSLELLSHSVRVMNPEPTALIMAPACDVILVDGRTDLPAVRSLCKLLETTGNTTPMLLVTTEGALTAITHEWGATDVVLHTAGPAEVDARIRLAIGRGTSTSQLMDANEISAGDLVINEQNFTATLRGRVLDLTYKEFELLKFLAQHPGRVFSRDHLLQEVWGYDYFGGTRTVDVHVRRLRAKLGPENEALIGTVRNVGYRYVATPVAERSTILV